MKLTLTERPQSVEELKNIMQEKFKPRLDCEFTLHYEDPDFDGQLSVLVDIQELPEKGTLKVVRSESDTSATASSDTDILPHIPVTQHQKNWPDAFPVPTFSYEVEYILAEGNAVFERSGKMLKLNRAHKHIILQNMAETMYSFKPYPNDRDVGKAAEALVTVHPCLKEPGSESGWYGWKVFAEFHRITNVNLRSQFFAKLDRHTPKLLILYRVKASRTGKTAEALHDILKIYDVQELRNVNMRRAVALCGLLMYFREDHLQIFKTWN
ncbi:hypothetical protein LDENG_00292370, partial [Lucifuga dentata]